MAILRAEGGAIHLTVDLIGWEPSEWIALAGLLATATIAVLVTRSSHNHDREMRELEFAEQARRREEDRRGRWLERAQEVAADARHALLTTLTPEAILAEGVERILVEFDGKLRTRFSLIYNFAPDQPVREAAGHASDQMIKYLSRAGVAANTRTEAGGTPRTSIEHRWHTAKLTTPWTS